IIIIIGFQVASYRNCASLTRCKRLSSYWFSTSVILKLRLGPSIKDVRRDGGGVVGQMRTPADRGRGCEKGSFFADVLYGRPFNERAICYLPLCPGLTSDTN